MPSHGEMYDRTTRRLICEEPEIETLNRAPKQSVTLNREQKQTQNRKHRAEKDPLRENPKSKP